MSACWKNVTGTVGVVVTGTLVVNVVVTVVVSSASVTVEVAVVVKTLVKTLEKGLNVDVDVGTVGAGKPNVVVAPSKFGYAFQTWFELKSVQVQI